MHLGIEKLPEHFIFPNGTMFWAKTSALLPLKNLKFNCNNVPEEPLPYDSTTLQAIAKLLPLTLSIGNFKIATTNILGVTR